MNANQNTLAGSATLISCLIDFTTDGRDPRESIIGQGEKTMETLCPICGNFTHDGWISVNELLPEDGDKVLVLDRMEIKMAICWKYSREWWRDGIMEQLHSVSHWLRLPDSPEID